MKRLYLCVLVFFWGSLLFPTEGSSQGTKADYERAQALASRFRSTVFADRFLIQWTEDEQAIYYRVQTSPKEIQYKKVDLASGQKESLFDHQQLADAINKHNSQMRVSAKFLDLNDLRWNNKANTLQFVFSGKRWDFKVQTGALQLTDYQPTTSLINPARRQRQSRAGGEETHINWKNLSQEKLALAWVDPSGKKTRYAVLEPGGQHRQHTFAGHLWIVESADKGEEWGAVIGMPWELSVEIPRNKPVFPNSDRKSKAKSTKRAPTKKADSNEQLSHLTLAVDGHNLVVRDERQQTTRPVTTDGTAKRFYLTEPAILSADGRYVLATQRHAGGDREIFFIASRPNGEITPRLEKRRYLKPGDPIPQVFPVLVDLVDAKCRPLDTSLCPNPWSLDRFAKLDGCDEVVCLYNQRGHQILRLLGINLVSGTVRLIHEEKSATFVDYANKTYFYRLARQNEALLMSEKTGWNQLWKLDLVGQRPPVRVTQGNWVLRRVLHVDEKAGKVFFLANGVYPHHDPYYRHVGVVDLDGKNQVWMTTDDADHEAEFSPQKRYIITRSSRVDSPEKTSIVRTSDGKKIADLETADVTRLLNAGYEPPERFMAPGRDGKTPIFGIIIKPTNFDPSKKYPIIEQIYAGPHGSFVPKTWGLQLGMRQMAELGFIVVQIDGMGTNWRHKAFHDVCWQNLKDSGFPDRLAWIKAAASTRPWMDCNRVGIYGGSAGGQSAMRALLDYSDFYSVAVADCGCHDNRVDKIWWNELWMGWPVGNHYAASSNVEDAGKLKGKLLLVVGELDDNVDPASTYQVADALQKANKDYELLTITGAGHGACETPYGQRRRMDFFVRNLYHNEPRR